MSSEAQDTKQSEFDPVKMDITALPGWPGYRTRAGRSGLDYVDTCKEIGHMTGVFLHQFFTGSVWKQDTSIPVFVFIVVGIALITATIGGECSAVLNLIILAVCFFKLVTKFFASPKHDIEDNQVLSSATGDEE